MLDVNHWSLWENSLSCGWPELFGLAHIDTYAHKLPSIPSSSWMIVWDGLPHWSMKWLTPCENTHKGFDIWLACGSPPVPRWIFMGLISTDNKHNQTNKWNSFGNLCTDDKRSGEGALWYVQISPFPFFTCKWGMGSESEFKISSSFWWDRIKIRIISGLFSAAISTWVSFTSIHSSKRDF